MQSGPCWDPGTQTHRPIALSLSFKFIGGYSVILSPYRGAQSRLLYLIHPGKARCLNPYLFQHQTFTSFICSGSIMGNPEVCILIFSNAGNSNRMCTNVSFSAPHLLHEESALIILCSIYCTLICPVRSPTALPAFCNVSCPVYI